MQEETFPGPVPALEGLAASPDSEIPVLQKRHVKSAYARWAPVYDLVFTQVFRPGRKAAAAAASRVSGLVLDVGVGTGLELPMFDRGVRLVGVDLSEPMLRRASWRVREKNLHNVAGLGVMDATNLAFPAAHFDAVVAPFVLTVVPEPEASLTELARVVKPGGEIILVNHVGAAGGPMAWIEARLAQCSREIGWRPQFPWSIIGDWIDAHPGVRLLERRKLAPLGLFTLTRIKKL